MLLVYTAIHRMFFPLEDATVALAGAIFFYQSFVCFTVYVYMCILLAFQQAQVNLTSGTSSALLLPLSTPVKGNCVLDTKYD